MIGIALFFMSVAAIAASVVAWISIKDADRCWGWFLEAKKAAMEAEDALFAAEKRLHEAEDRIALLDDDKHSILLILEELVEDYTK